MRTGSWFSLVLAASILAPFANARAEFFERGLEVAAGYVTGELYLHDGTDAIWTRIRRAGIEYDERYGGGVTIGLIGGYATVSQDQGARLAGNYLGVIGHIAAVSGGPATLSLGGRYLYQNLGDDNSTPPRTIDWQEWGLDSRLEYRVAGQWTLAVGGRYDWVVADQLTKDLVATTATLKAQRHASRYLGLVFETDPGGFVAIALQRGMMDSSEIVFRRVY